MKPLDPDDREQYLKIGWWMLLAWLCSECWFSTGWVFFRLLSLLASIGGVVHCFRLAKALRKSLKK